MHTPCTHPLNIHSLPLYTPLVNTLHTPSHSPLSPIFTHTITHLYTTSQHTLPHTHSPFPCAHSLTPSLSNILSTHPLYTRILPHTTLYTLAIALFFFINPTPCHTHTHLPIAIPSQHVHHCTHSFITHI